MTLCPNWRTHRKKNRFNTGCKSTFNHQFLEGYSEYIFIKHQLFSIIRFLTRANLKVTCSFACLSNTGWEINSLKRRGFGAWVDLTVLDPFKVIKVKVNFIQNKSFCHEILLLRKILTTASPAITSAE